MIVEEVIRCFKTGTSVHMVSGRFIEVAVPIQRVIDETAGTTETLGVILVSASLDAIRDNREVLSDSVNLILLISFILALLLFFGGRWFYGLYFSEPHILEMGELICRYLIVIVLL